MASTVTVVFTDLVSSTALLSRVGEVAAEEMRQSHFAVLREAIQAHDGREVKNLGDGLMVVFTGAARAVAAAVAMQQLVERWSRRATEPLSLRVGIAAGDVDEADGDVFGLPVVQAARLCAAAEGGEILCSDLARMLAGSRVAAAFESVGALDLKGLDEGVAACRVSWEPLAESAVVGLPGRLTAVLTSGSLVVVSSTSACWTRGRPHCASRFVAWCC